MIGESLDYASIIVSKCLSIEPVEEVVIFVDNNNLEIAEALAYSIKNVGAKCSIFYIADSIRPTERITDVHSIALVSANAIIYILETKSKKIDLSTEMAFRHYLRALPIQYKGRVCMMPGFSEEMISAITIDYSKLKDKANYLKKAMYNKNIRIKTDLGTDVVFNLNQRKIEADIGDISIQGSLGNIPAGEIFTSPVEETVNGILVVDGSISGLGKVINPFCIELESGRIKDVYPSEIEDELMEKFKKICMLDPPNTQTIGEFGIGLNPGAKIIGNILMDEKVEGTIHFAFGDSYGLGKISSKFHTDLLIRNPSIFANEMAIMDNGKFIINI